MRDGKYEEQQACLRLKIDMTHPNPCMRDPVAYRIKKMPHPHVGDKWIIYPTYDYTHCLIDSFEWITHSCCTLEFEIRRDVYYWILQNLELYRPYQWEFSRLNISNTILSKRYIQEMVDTNIISGWDDPRIFTLMALKRRG
jgi:glutaminyl-tRNA synthetase